MCCSNSKRATKLFSTPAKEEREVGGVRVWVSCWVVRSKIQRPRREMERVVKRRRVGRMLGLEGEEGVVSFGKSD